jgi:hypothetical protein
MCGPKVFKGVLLPHSVASKNNEINYFKTRRACGFVTLEVNWFKLRGCN